MNTGEDFLRREQQAPGNSMLIAVMTILQCLLLFWPGAIGAQSRGHLGVFIQNAPRPAEGSEKPREGVIILGLMRNSPAEQGGLKRGDIILNSMANRFARWKICNVC